MDVNEVFAALNTLLFLIIKKQNGTTSSARQNANVENIPPLWQQCSNEVFL